MGFPSAASSGVAALDFLSDKIRVVMASFSGEGAWRVEGVGESHAEGFESGRVSHLSDAAESVAAALSAAERAAGRRAESVLYTLDDAQAVFRRYRASRPLTGEGQVRSADVSAVFSAAKRLAGGFETVNIYAAELGFVIDDQDPVVDPVGVFGRKLELEAGFLQSRAEILAEWQDLMRRLFRRRSWAVPIEQAAVWGAASSETDRCKRILLFERAGRTLVCRFSGTAVESCERVAGSMLSDPALPAEGELLIAGEQAERTAERLSAAAGRVVRVVRPESLAGFHSPLDVPTAGLLAVARQRERRRLTAQRGHGWARKMRRRLTSFWNDYF